MRYFNYSMTILATAALIGCGGSTSDSAPKIKFSSQVSFGDSLSDVGSYAVGTVKTLGGGKYTVNSADTKNWTELVAASLGLPAPCPAQTGLDGLASQGFNVPVTNKAGCTSYAQGGARVTNPVGPGNKLLGGNNAVLGQLTVPVVTQIQNHLAAMGGKFKGDEVVFVLAGANDIFIQASTLSADATAAGQTAATAAVTAAVPGQIQKDIASGKCVPTDAQASNCVAGAVATLTLTVGATAGADAGAAFAKNNAQKYVDAVGAAGAELASYVNNQILSKGAKYVVVIGVPDMSKTPSAITQSVDTRTLLNGMSFTFNIRLSGDLAGKSNVLYVDLFTRFNDEIANPAAYGLSNVTIPACDLSPAKNVLGSSLVCTPANVITGDVSHYLFADTVHPTPYGYSLLSDLVTSEMKARGWL